MLRIGTSGWVYPTLEGRLLPVHPAPDALVRPLHEVLEEWARRIRDWLDRGLDVYVYFNNDAFGNAVRNALTLKAMLWA